MRDLSTFPDTISTLHVKNSQWVRLPDGNYVQLWHWEDALHFNISPKGMPLCTSRFFIINFKIYYTKK